MRRLITALAAATLALAAATLALAGCGDDDADSQPAEAPSSATATQESAPAEPAARRGTKITLRGSEFGRMLWGPGRQAIYIFERDAKDRSRCYGDCAEAWPPSTRRAARSRGGASAVRCSA